MVSDPIIMIALPGDKYFGVPRSILEKHAMPKTKFQKMMKDKWKKGDTVFQKDGSMPPIQVNVWWEKLTNPRLRTQSDGTTAVTGVRG